MNKFMEKAESFAAIFRVITPILLAFATYNLNEIKDEIREVKESVAAIDEKYDQKLDDALKERMRMWKLITTHDTLLNGNYWRKRMAENEDYDGKK